MQTHHIGWLVILGALGAFLALFAVEVTGLQSWSEATTPLFVGKTLGHLGIVIGGIVGGRYLPQPAPKE
jgi:uncharacterized membrane protein